MGDKTVPLKWFGKVVGKATISEDNIIMAEIDDNLITKEERDIFFGDYTRYVSIDMNKSKEQ